MLMQRFQSYSTTEEHIGLVHPHTGAILAGHRGPIRSKVAPYRMPPVVRVAGVHPGNTNSGIHPTTGKPLAGTVVLPTVKGPMSFSRIINPIAVQKQTPRLAVSAKIPTVGAKNNPQRTIVKNFLHL